MTARIILRTLAILLRAAGLTIAAYGLRDVLFPASASASDPWMSCLLNMIVAGFFWDMAQSLSRQVEEDWKQEKEGAGG
jgi:hypothetical protein